MRALPVLLALGLLACGEPPTRITGFSVVPRQLPARGGTVRVDWATQSATQAVVLAGERVIPVPGSGSLDLDLPGTTTVLLIVDGPRGHASRNALVTANPPPAPGVSGQVVETRTGHGVAAALELDGQAIATTRTGHFTADAGATWSGHVSLSGEGGVRHLDILGATERAPLLPVQRRERTVRTATVELSGTYEGLDGHQDTTFTVARVQAPAAPTGGLLFTRDRNFDAGVTVRWQGEDRLEASVLALRAEVREGAASYYGASDPLRFTLDAGATLRLPPLRMEPVPAMDRTLYVLSEGPPGGFLWSLEATAHGLSFDVGPAVAVGASGGVALPVLPHVPLRAALSQPDLAPARTLSLMPLTYDDPARVPLYLPPGLDLPPDAGLGPADGLPLTLPHPQACELAFTRDGEPEPERLVWTARPFTLSELTPPLAPGPWHVQARCFPELATVDGLLEPGRALARARGQGRLMQTWSPRVLVQVQGDAGVH